MKNVLVTTYWSYKEPLIQTYTLPYVRIIKKNLDAKSKVYLFTMEQQQLAMSKEEWEFEKQKLNAEGIVLIRSKYFPFGIKMALNFLLVFLKLLYFSITKHISTIHAWCTPGGVLGYVVSLITCKPLIIDSYEPHAESMVENGEWNKNSKAFKILFWFEKRMSKRAKTVIALTEGMKAYAKEKYNTSFQNYYVKPALVDLDKFYMEHPKKLKLIEKYGLTDKVVCIYAGKLGGIYLDDEVFDLFKVMHNYWGNRIKILLLTSKDKTEVQEQIVKFGIPNGIVEFLYVDYSEIHNYYRLADFAINPVKPVLSKRYCTSIKDGEYWAMGLPVIIPDNISDDSNIISENGIGAVIEEFTHTEYLKAIKKIDILLKGDRVELKQKIRSVAVKYRNYSIAEDIYQEIYKK
ncbi:MAG: hypothetical protein PF517_03070 [Salinivirgaceae bacterium]|jgi:glycosyltransferase involved in cell wall biosynthesis|nr:hypothetical protein [Salinivirgaceae bacterium]